MLILLPGGTPCWREQKTEPGQLSNVNFATGPPPNGGGSTTPVAGRPHLYIVLVDLLWVKVQLLGSVARADIRAEQCLAIARNRLLLRAGGEGTPT